MRSGLGFVIARLDERETRAGAALARASRLCRLCGQDAGLGTGVFSGRVN